MKNLTQNRKLIYLIFSLSFFSFNLLFSQPKSFQQDSTLNNLIHPGNYVTNKLGELGKMTKMGFGKQSMILIPGIGFGGDIFNNFMEENKDKYTMYSVTAAGFGNTQAPPIPDTSSKYSEQTWINGTVNGIINLIEKEKLQNPIIVGHFIVGSQVALILALNYPDLIGKVVILSGVPYQYYPTRKQDGTFDWSNENKVSLEQRSNIVEKYWAPVWFKTVTEKTWNDNNWNFKEYTNDSSKGIELVNISSLVPLQVNVRYILEYMTFDASTFIDKIKIPTLILIPEFNEHFFTGSEVYLEYLLQVSWNSIKNINPVVQFKMIPNARIFMWYDNPETVYNSINSFANNY